MRVACLFRSKSRTESKPLFIHVWEACERGEDEKFRSSVREVERLRLISARIPLARILHVVHLELLRVCVSLEYRVRFVIVSDGGCFVADDDGASILLVVSVRPIAVACPNGVNSGGGRSGACGMNAGRREDIDQGLVMTIQTGDIKRISKQVDGNRRLSTTHPHQCRRRLRLPHRLFQSLRMRL